MIQTNPRNQSMKPTDTYFDLVRRHPLHSIRSESELDAAQAVIDDLLRQELDEGESQYLDALSDLVMLYERDHHPIPPLPPHKLLAFVLQERALTQADLVRMTGIAKATISDLTSGKRPFTVGHMRQIADALNLPAAAFVG